MAWRCAMEAVMRSSQGRLRRVRDAPPYLRTVTLEGNCRVDEGVEVHDTDDEE